MISYCAYTTTISSYIHTGKLRISYAYVIAIWALFFWDPRRDPKPQMGPQKDSKTKKTNYQVSLCKQLNMLYSKKSMHLGIIHASKLVKVEKKAKKKRKKSKKKLFFSSSENRTQDLHTESQKLTITLEITPNFWGPYLGLGSVLGP
jgi:hypothetical protein